MLRFIGGAALVVAAFPLAIAIFLLGMLGMVWLTGIGVGIAGWIVAWLRG